MATADDTASTHSDLLWDHTGDVESDPLLGRINRNEASGGRSAETMTLSFDQAQELMKVLDNTRSVLNSFVQQTQDSGVVLQQPRGSWWARNCFPSGRRRIASYIFIITAALQVFMLSAVSVIDIFPQYHAAVAGTCAFMILLQLLNFVVIIMVSMRLARQLTKHKVSLLLLAQSYLATLLLFAGIYVLTYRMNAKSWKFIREPLSGDNPDQVFVLYSKFLFYSVSTATLCGSDNVLPTEWYNCVFVAAQMLMSFVYFASILGQTMSKDTKYWLGVEERSPLPTHSPQTPQQSSRTNRVYRPVSQQSSAQSPPPVSTHYGSGDATAPHVMTSTPNTRSGHQQKASLVTVEHGGVHSINASPTPS